MNDRDQSQRLFRIIFGTRGVSRDVADELSFHLAERTDEMVARGLRRDEAERAVEVRFGSRVAIGAEMTRIDRRIARRRSFAERVETAARDVRLGIRSLRHNLGFTVVAVLTLALGIGATTVIFSAVYGVLLRPIAAPGLGRLVVIRENLPGLKLMNANVSPPDVLDLAADGNAFDAVGGFTGWYANLTGSGEPLRLLGAETMGAFFDLFAVRPILGRLYGAANVGDESSRVVVLSYALWHGWGGGDPGIIGKRLKLNGRDYEVIGVLPEDFRYPRAAQLFVPLELSPEVRAQRKVLTMTALGRLRPTVSLAQAGARLGILAAQWNAAAPSSDSRVDLAGTPFLSYQAGELRPLLLMLMAAVSFVLLIACGNVANLQLVRGIGRSKELAIRAALGAGKWPIARQLLAESAVLAVVAGSVGLAFAGLVIYALGRANGMGYAALTTVRLQPVVVAVACGIVVVCAVAVGLVPALRATRADLQRALHRGTSDGPRRSRFLQASVVTQVALSLLLLLGAGLLVRSLSQLLRVDPGFQAANVFSFRVSLPQEAYQTPEQRALFFDRLNARLAATTGVATAGEISDLPFGEGRNSSPFTLPGVPAAASDLERHADMRFVEADYFRTVGMPIVRGRSFNSDDRATSKLVAIIDERLARQYFGAQDPLGQTIDQGRPCVIIGVVGTIKQGDLREEDKATIYYSYAQAPWYSTLYVAMRTTLSTTAATNLARHVVAELDKNMPVFDLQSMQQRIDASISTRRLATTILGSLAALALLLALLGIYGVLSYGTSQRTHELGIRLALGATPRNVMALVVGGGLALVGIGLVIGIAGFLAAATLMSGLVYGVTPRDPVAIATGVGMLIVGGLVATIVPACRAAMVDPLLAIRKE